MFNPFKYRPISQQDDEDEDVLYQAKSIPLSNLGETKYDDEVELELPRKPPTARRRSPFALCLVIAICIIFVSLLITLIFYIANPLQNFTGNEPDSTSLAQSAAYLIPATSVTSNFSNTTVVKLKSSSEISMMSSTSLAPTSTTYESTSSTAAGTSSNKLQSTASTGIVLTTSWLKLAEMNKSHVLTSKSTSPSPMPTTHVSTAVTSTSEITNSNITTQMLNSTIVTALIEPSTTTTDSSMVSSSNTLYASTVSSNQFTESTVTMPTATNEPTTHNNTIHWHTMNLRSSSESTPVVIDVNSDGVDDIIYAYASFTKNLDMYYCPSNDYYKNNCVEDAGYPVCGAILVAINGLNGELIWSTNLTRPVFGIRCVVDVNGDGETDCFVTGRYHQWDTIDKKTGKKIWEVDKSLGFPGYNFYYPLPLEDFDGDGIVDILNIHGGDQMYSPDETDRSPALLVVVSGKTGKKLIDPIVVPDGRESYMSPVRYMFAHTDVILFGTGGETISGSLWAITIESFKKFVKSHLKPRKGSDHDTEFVGCLSEFGSNSNKFRPKYDAMTYQIKIKGQHSILNCPSLGQHLPIPNKHKFCLYELYHSTSKGLIIPPVIIDMNNDSVQDLVIQSFSGHIRCVNGVNGMVLWSRHISGSESYNVPAPLFYNDDDTPDLFLRVNIGEWDDYNYSYVVIVDGTDGKALWTMNSSYATMQSAVTLMSVNHSQDAVIFFAYNLIDKKDINSTTVNKRQMDTDQESPFHDTTDAGVPQNSSFHDETDASMPLDAPENADEGEDGDDDLKVDIKHLGEQFWNLSNTSFPDPLIDPEGFIESCKYNQNQSSVEKKSYLYFVTRGLVSPIASAVPGILIPGHGMVYTHKTKKRHGSFEILPGMLNYMRNNAWRCSYVQYPSTYTPLTPVIADLNHDGKAELIYAFQYVSGDSFIGASLTQAVLDLHVQTIENMMQSDVDFSKFLPMEKQSWTTYMGTKGDATYHFHQT